MCVCVCVCVYMYICIYVIYVIYVYMYILYKKKMTRRRLVDGKNNCVRGLLLDIKKIEMNQDYYKIHQKWLQV